MARCKSGAMEKILVISYDFPPTGGAKTRRTLKFLKYMLQYRCMPIVLTTNATTRFAFDPSLVAEIPPEVHVHRAFDLSFLFARRGSISRKSNLREAKRVTNSGRGLKFVTRLFGRFISWVKKWASMVAVPDTFLLFWGSFAVIRGIRVILKEDPAIIYCTGPPFSNHVIGVCLKKMTKKPLVVDFRDAWSSNPGRRMKYPVARQPIELVLERFVIRNADMVVSTTDGITQDFRRRYGLEPGTKFVTLPNGYDKEEFCIPRESARGRAEKLRMVHTGKLSLERSPKSLLVALRRLFDENPDLEDDVEVYLVGEIGAFNDGKTIENYLDEFSLRSVVKLTGHVPQAEAIRYQMSADILLLIIGLVPPEEVSTYGIASKVFDYMLAGRPVLTIAEPGPVSELVEKTHIGPALTPYDIDGISGYLSYAMEAFKSGQLEIKSVKEEIDKYDFRKLTGQLVESFHILTRA